MPKPPKPPKPPKTKPVRQCEYAIASSQEARCTANATCKWGDNWFCDKHGGRDASGESHAYVPPMRDSETSEPINKTGEVLIKTLHYNLKKRTFRESRPTQGVICVHGGNC